MSDVPAPAYAPATDPSADGAARIALPTEATMTPRQREVRDALVAGPRKGVRGPMGVWLVRPDLAESAQALGRYCRFESSLPTRLSELAICTTARAWPLMTWAGVAAGTASPPRSPARRPRSRAAPPRSGAPRARASRPRSARAPRRAAPGQG